MKILTVLVMLFLIGCQTDDNHGYGYNIDGVTPLGIEYRGHTIDRLSIDSEFDNVYQCIKAQWLEPINNNYNGYGFFIDLMVFFVDQIEDTDKQGRFYSNNNLIVIVDNNSPYHNDYSIYVYRHELVHYILKKLTSNSHDYHQSNFFYSCVYF